MLTNSLITSVCLVACLNPSADLRHDLLAVNKSWGRDSLALQIYHINEVRRSPNLRKKEVKQWLKLLRNNSTISVSDDLDKNIKVCEIALVCIEGIAGNSFYPGKNQSAHTRDILSVAINEDVHRFVITSIDPKDIPQIHAKIQTWLNRD